MYIEISLAVDGFVCLTFPFSRHFAISLMMRWKKSSNESATVADFQPG
jgi:hypothetical protein